MKTTHVCPKCRGTRLLLVDRMPDASDNGGWDELKVARTTRKGVFGFELLDAVGALSAIVCRECGYTELYTNGADQIPVDGTHVREITGPKR